MKHQESLDLFMKKHPDLKNLKIVHLRVSPGAGIESFCTLVGRCECLKIVNMKGMGSHPTYTLPNAKYLETRSISAFACPQLTELNGESFESREDLFLALKSSPKLTTFSCCAYNRGLHHGLWNIHPRKCMLEHIFLRLPISDLFPVVNELLLLANVKEDKEIPLRKREWIGNMTCMHRGLIEKSQFPRLKKVSVSWKTLSERIDSESGIGRLVRQGFVFLEDAGIQVEYTVGELTTMNNCLTELMSCKRKT